MSPGSRQPRRYAGWHRAIVSLLNEENRRHKDTTREPGHSSEYSKHRRKRPFMERVARDNLHSLELRLWGLCRVGAPGFKGFRHRQSWPETASAEPLDSKPGRPKLQSFDATPVNVRPRKNVDIPQTPQFLDSKPLKPKTLQSAFDS